MNGAERSAIRIIGLTNLLLTEHAAPPNPLRRPDDWPRRSAWRCSSSQLTTTAGWVLKWSTGHTGQQIPSRIISPMSAIPALSKPEAVALSGAATYPRHRCVHVGLGFGRPTPQWFVILHKCGLISDAVDGVSARDCVSVDAQSVLDAHARRNHDGSTQSHHYRRRREDLGEIWRKRGGRRLDMPDQKTTSAEQSILAQR
jgi:hypothetical protein